jgi:hypothetical protein
MKNYFSIEGKLYTLTNKQVKKINKLFPYDLKTNDDNHEARLQWIECNGKLIGTCENLAY